MADLSSYLRRIFEKKPIDETDEQLNKDFSPFIINRFMSCDKQFVFLANAMNRPQLTPKMVFDFYDCAIPKTKRFIRYNAKKEKAEKELMHIMQWFGCNTETAKQYHKILAEEEMKEIIHHFEKERIGR